MHRNKKLILGMAFGLICAGVLGTISVNWGGEAFARGKKTTFYFVRHGEDHIALEQTNDEPPLQYREACVRFDNGNPDDDCCIESLNPQGELRATLLAEYFREKKITEKLTHIIASHKVRTRQTVGPTAADALAAGIELPDDDQNHGDGVQQIPAGVDECDLGFEGSTSSRDYMIEALANIEPGSTALVAAHSPTLYPIMESLGVDTSDPVEFPRRANGKVDGFNNLWIVEVDADGHGKLKKHILLNFDLKEDKKKKKDD